MTLFLNTINDFQWLSACMMEATDDLVFLIDPAEHTVRFDADKLFKLCHVHLQSTQPEDLLSLAISLIHPQDLNRFIDDTKLLGVPGAVTQTWSGDYRFARQDGTHRRCCFTAFPGSGATLVHIKELKEDEEAECRRLCCIERDALTDAHTTEIYKARVRDYLEKRNHKGVMLYLRIASFHHLNVHYGARFGDGALIRLGRLIKGFVREQDCIARYGDDAYVVLIMGARSKTALDASLHNLEKTFRDSLGSTLDEEDTSIICGSAYIPEDGTDYQTLLDAMISHAAPITDIAEMQE